MPCGIAGSRGLGPNNIRTRGPGRPVLGGAVRPPPGVYASCSTLFGSIDSPRRIHLPNAELVTHILLLCCSSGSGWAIAIKADEQYIDSNLEACKQQIINNKATQYYLDWVQDLRGSAYIEIFSDKLLLFCFKRLISSSISIFNSEPLFTFFSSSIFCSTLVCF